MLQITIRRIRSHILIKGIHNTVVDEISHLDFDPSEENKENWITFTKCLCFYTMHAVEDTSPPNHKEIMQVVFANHIKTTAIYPLAVREIAKAQTQDKMLDKLTLLEKYKPQLIEDVQVLCKDDKLVIPKELEKSAVEWYHNFLQHPGTTCLEETLHASMHWKDLMTFCLCLGQKVP